MSSIFLLLSCLATALAKTISLDWDIGWVTRSPDGYTRPVIGINGQWPLPTLEADLGDTIRVNVHNSLVNETTGIHWHGMYQRGTPEIDGASSVSQCPIPPGGTLTYTFTAYPAGTFWYHSHNKGQYPDGLRAPMIIRDPSSNSSEARAGADRNYTLTVSDWYHDEIPPLLQAYLDPSNTAGGMPVPNSSLTNDGKSTTFCIKPSETIIIRIINVSALATYFIEFEEHNMTVYAVDEIPVHPQSWEALEIVPGQRYDIAITGLQNPTRNYAFIVKMAVIGLQNNGTLNYDHNWSEPEPLSLDAFPVGDDFALAPLDNEPLLGPVDQTIILNVRNIYIPGVGHRITQGPDSYNAPTVPSLYTALTTGASATNPDIYGQVNPYILNSGGIVEVVVNSYEDSNAVGSGRRHPMHLHGHSFQVVSRETTLFDGNETAFPAVPMRRDTTTLAAGGSLVVRFRADNPGAWLFHCHIEWHLDAGMASTFVEAPDRLLDSGVSIPLQHLAVCAAQGIPTSGNCAGNTANLLNTATCHVYDKNPLGAAIVSNGTQYRRR